MKTFYAREPHVDGAVRYEPGMAREVDEQEVRHLVELGVLGDQPPAAAKAEKAPANKAEGPAPANKAG